MIADVASDEDVLGIVLEAGEITKVAGRFQVNATGINYQLGVLLYEWIFEGIMVSGKNYSILAGETRPRPADDERARDPRDPREAPVPSIKTTLRVTLP